MVFHRAFLILISTHFDTCKENQAQKMHYLLLEHRRGRRRRGLLNITTIFELLMSINSAEQLICLLIFFVESDLVFIIQLFVEVHFEDHALILSRDMAGGNVKSEFPQ